MAYAHPLHQHCNFGGLPLEALTAVAPAILCLHHIALSTSGSAAAVIYRQFTSAPLCRHVRSISFAPWWWRLGPCRLKGGHLETGSCTGVAVPRGRGPRNLALPYPHPETTSETGLGGIESLAGTCGPQLQPFLNRPQPLHRLSSLLQEGNGRPTPGLRGAAGGHRRGH